MKFKMWEAKEGGYFVSFETSTGKYSSTWFASPLSSIDHVDIGYLKGRLSCISRESQVKFIKKRFKEEAKKLGIS